MRARRSRRPGRWEALTGFQQAAVWRKWRGGSCGRQQRLKQAACEWQEGAGTSAWRKGSFRGPEAGERPNPVGLTPLRVTLATMWRSRVSGGRCCHCQVSGVGGGVRGQARTPLPSRGGD